MTPESCARMAQYNCWMNTRLYDATATLAEARIFEDRGAFFGSLFDTLNHLVVADMIWLHRFARHPGLDDLARAMAVFPRPRSLKERVASSLPALRGQRVALDEVVIQLGANVTQEQLAGTLRYANTAGEAQARNFGALLQHFFNHQTHHRGQATTLLSQCGVDVGVTDLLAVIPRAT